MKNILVSCLTLLSIVFSSTAFASSNEVKINGSTTVLPVIQKAGEVFMKNNPSVTVSISGGGSGNGIKALNEKLCDIAMSSRDIKSTEIEDAKKRGVTPTRFAVAWDAIVPIVHPSNPVKSVSIEQLRDIYSGRITNWKDLGGVDGKIVVTSRDTSSGTYESWAELVMHKEKVSPAALLQASSGAVVTSITKNKRAIGYVGFGYLNKNIKALTVNDVEASASSVLEKKWPISRELYLFTDGEPKDSVKAFIDFMFDPQKGQKIVKEVGFIPVK
ncbi:phosphate ABC transporter substrate-binding protein [Desulfovibrio litoralis]|uniref:Phosphate-binding protein n=1 Tax=Desulfovibrio litoralis DSM 11393 TaxID=1121455 RepID=A0A1M7SP25_9BACT|nr:phosphate ABC transporter substrate-binding protein [Desulfovibrio litoralis]SHN60241.1 phosphate transport system substrate-binding protein [Desulfovibrio litoralis DSM 11393]